MTIESYEWQGDMISSRVQVTTSWFPNDSVRAQVVLALTDFAGWNTVPLFRLRLHDTDELLSKLKVVVDEFLAKKLCEPT